MIWHHGFPQGEGGMTNSTPSWAAFTRMKKLSSITHSPSSFETCSVCPFSMQGDGAAPLGVPGFVRYFVAVGVEPRDVLDDAEQFAITFLADFAILKELAAVQVGMGEPEIDQLAGKVAQPLARVVQVPVKPAEFVVLAIAVVVAALATAPPHRRRAAWALPAKASGWPENCASVARAVY